MSKKCIHTHTRRALALLLSLVLLLVLTPFAFAEGEGTREEYAAMLTEAGFPESYIEPLWQLHQQYPAWVFTPFLTGVDWWSAVEEEHVLGRSLIWSSAPSSWKSTQDGAYNWTDSTWNELDSGGWVAASREIIAYYMDPRNSLDASSVFQFLYQGYDPSVQTYEGLTAMAQGTFLAGGEYVDDLWEAGTSCGVSPYILAAMMIQEMGVSGQSDSISGTNSRFPGYYNAFNLGAYKAEGFSAVERGLWYASGGNNGSGTSYGRPWNSLHKAIIGGAQYYAVNFVNQGQNTLYLKRFNVQGGNMYRNQYMTNVAGARSEGQLLADAYSGTMRALPLSFSIPVFSGMPGYVCSQPGGDGSPNTKLAELSVSNGTLSPAFHRDITDYTVIVPYTAEAVSVSARPISPGASVSGTGGVSLAVGTNDVTVTVYAENGAAGQYTLHIIRAESTGAVSFSGPYHLQGDGRVTGVTPGTGAGTFLSLLGAVGGTAEMLSADGSAKSAEALVSTGDVLKVYYENEGVKTLYGAYSVLIYGDVNGDGTVQISDLIKVRNHLLGTGTLSGLSHAAADVNRDGSVKINDLIKLRNHLLGESIVQ